MSGCCDPSGYHGAFNTKTAERSVRAFLKKGLDSTAGPMVEVIAARGIPDAAVLEVGAGSGTALVSLLEAGAAAATAFDISAAYEEKARALLATRGITAPVQWNTGDFVALSSTVPSADVVFLNRVVCCYPDMTAMVDAAAAKSDRLLAVSYPRDRWPTRLFMMLSNRWLRFRQNTFRVFLHDPDAVAARIAASGFSEVASGTTTAWHWAVWQRTGGA